MSKYVCNIDNVKGLTKGKEYDITNSEGESVLVINDFSEPAWHNGKLFTDVEGLKIRIKGLFCVVAYEDDTLEQLYCRIKENVPETVSLPEDYKVGCIKNGQYRIVGYVESSVPFNFGLFRAGLETIAREINFHPYTIEAF